MTDIDYCKGAGHDGAECPRRKICQRWHHYLSLQRTGSRHDYPMTWDGGDCPMYQQREFVGG